MTEVIDDRHLHWSSLREYLAAGAPAIVPIAGEPDVALVIEPADQRIAVRSSWSPDGSIPELAQYRHLDTRVGTGAAGDWVEFGVRGAGVLREAYPMLISVADHVQLHGQAIGTAIGEVVASYRELLSALGRLSEHQELGLYGELLVLGHLIGSIGEHRAVDSWRGPTHEEHDFGLHKADLEVKTTLSDDRSHRISSLTQLEPSPGRELWLLSVQLTTRGIGGSTLPELVAHVNGRLSDRAVQARFADRLTRVGWSSTDSHLYDRRFVRRSKVGTFRITPEFPAITARRLAVAGLAIERFSDISYILHTAGLQSDPPPTELEGL